MIKLANLNTHSQLESEIKLNLLANLYIQFEEDKFKAQLWDRLRTDLEIQMRSQLKPQLTERIKSGQIS